MRLLLQPTYSAICLVVSVPIVTQGLKRTLRSRSFDAEWAIILGVGFVFMLTAAWVLPRCSRIGAWLAGFTGVAFGFHALLSVLIAFQMPLPGIVQGLFSACASALGLYLAFKLDRQPKTNP